MRSSKFRRYINICSLYLLLSTVYCQLSTAQSVFAILRADSSQIQIGDHLNIRLTLKHSNNLTVPFPSVADTLGNLELIAASKIDTSVEGSNKVLSQLYTVSAFDSGNIIQVPLRYFSRTAAEGLTVFPPTIFRLR